LFSEASWFDCIASNGLAVGIDLRFSYCNAPKTLHIPSDAVSPVPSDFLCQSLMKLRSFWERYREGASRMLVDAILTHLVCNSSDGKLLGYREVDYSWESRGMVYTGTLDCVLGSSKGDSVETIDSPGLVVSADSRGLSHAI
jgi:hypothetical protein